ncbi:MAG TPA: ABC transporter permease [Firmicutes bacterium]|nr:ABC transporter permease [Bacillota bacterium]
MEQQTVTKPTTDLRGRFAWKEIGPFASVIALVILGTAINSTFLSPANLTNVLTRSAFTGTIAIGATFVIATGAIDLSVGAMAAFNSGLMIILMNYLVKSWGATWLTIAAAMALSLVLGVAGGFINGFVITKGRIESFIVTLGTMGIFRSLVTYLADGGTLSLNLALRGVYRPVYYGSFLGIPIPLIVFFIVAVVGSILLNKTRFGRYVLAIGSNADVAHYSAINVNRIRTITFMLQGVCVAVATMIYVPRLGSASSTTGLGWELEAIAAVIIGGTAMKGGSARIWGTVAGAIIFSIIGNILNLSDVISQYLNGAVQGLIIIGAVLLQRTNKE